MGKIGKNVMLNLFQHLFRAGWLQNPKDETLKRVQGDNCIKNIKQKEVFKNDMETKLFGIILVVLVTIEKGGIP